jgi:predicted anti-sigma-YlaC factor YlaD
MRPTSSLSCDRTRALISCGLDGRLHDLERRFLEAHLRRCDDCKSFSEETEWFTSAMRTAEPLRPSVPVALPSRRRRIRVPQRTVASAAAAAVVLVLAGNVALTTPGHDNPEGALAASGMRQSVLGGDSIRSLRRADLVSGRLSFATPGSEPVVGANKPALPAAG